MYDAFTPPPGARGAFMIAPFSCVMAPTKRVISRKAYSAYLSLGLLSNTPDTDGEGGVELVADDYQRQTVQLISKDSKTFAVAHKVAFALLALPAIKCLAAFNEANEVEAYGVPVSIRTGPTAAQLMFAAHAIVVRAI